MATEQVNKMIFQIIFDDTGVTRKIGNAEVSVKKFDRELKKAALSTKQLNNELSGRAKLTTNAGLAGATLTELGRTISDSNYGIRGMANNLSQLSTLFITMISKVDDNIKGFARLGVTLKMLWRELMGPLGIILAFQIFLARLERADMKKRELTDTTDKLTKAEGAAAVQLKELLYAIENNTLSYNELEIAIKNANDKYDDLNIVIDENGTVTEDSIVSINNKIIALENLAKANAAVQKFEEIYAKQLEMEIRHRNEMNETDKVIGFDRIKRITSFGTAVENTEDETQTRRENRVASLQETQKAEKEVLDKELADLRAYVDEHGILSDFFNTNRANSRKEGNDKIADEIESFNQKTRELLAKNEFELLRIQYEADEKRLKAAGATEEQIGQVKLYYMIQYYQLLQEKRLEDFENEKKYNEEVKKATEFLLRERIKEIKEFESIQKQMFSSLSTLLGGFSDVQKEIHQGNIDRINREKDLVLQNDELTQKEKERRLRQIESQEIAAQKRKIKSERDMFTLQQTLKIAQAALSLKLYLMEQTQEAELLKSKATGYSAEVTMDAEKNIAAGTGSIGKFVSVLGPIAGPIAYGAMIAGMIATIVKARKQAKNAIKNLVPSTNISDGSTGGGAAVQAPAFNVVGATQTSQLAQTIAGAEDKPLRAYVVASDVTTAQELERSTIEGASIG
jgi:hypothetical protein